MVEDSNRWIPPPMTVGVSDHKTAAQRGDRREDHPLSDLQVGGGGKPPGQLGCLV